MPSARYRLHRCVAGAAALVADETAVLNAYDAVGE
jgi:hypothetical protein